MNRNFFHVEDAKSWNESTQKMAKMILSDVEIYVVSAVGWYYPENIVEIFHSYDEALKFLGFNSKKEYEKYLEERKEYSKHSEDFWYYEIEKVNFEKMINKIIYDTVLHR